MSKYIESGWLPNIFDSMGTDVANPAVAKKCWIDGRRVCLELEDERTVSFPVSKYPLLANASQEDLKKVELRVNGMALRWETLDEDIWVDDAVHGRFPRKQPDS